MFCLRRYAFHTLPLTMRLTISRSWLPLLFIPTNASPAFILLFFICTYFLHRPCVYCSVLLLILFVTSCNWSDRCFFDLSSNWFIPRAATTTTTGPSSSAAQCPPLAPVDGSSCTDAAAQYNATIVNMFNTTAKAALHSAAESHPEWSGLGVQWLRSLLGQREWHIDWMDLYIKL